MEGQNRNRTQLLGALSNSRSELVRSWGLGHVGLDYDYVHLKPGKFTNAVVCNPSGHKF